jgi:hypothetical protein
MCVYVCVCVCVYVFVCVCVCVQLDEGEGFDAALRGRVGGDRGVGKETVGVTGA